MSTDIRDYWTRTRAIRVTTPSGPGRLLDSTPLEVQVARGKIGVILDGVTTGVQYFEVKDIAGLPESEAR